MWMYDLAREQAPTLSHLRRIFQLTRGAGYTHIGLYLEHRFAYPSAPWAHGARCLTPEMVRTLRAEFPDLQVVPFLNLLGHFEGMFQTERGKRFAEERMKGLQACPSNPEFVELATRLLDDALAVFDSEIIHIGGDETYQLGRCPRCAEVVANAPEGSDGKALLYGNHFRPLAERVLNAGRRPAVWADMFDDHPSALGIFPPSTLLFDWRYFSGPRETSAKLRQKGFDVVCCPAIQTYNALWMHLPQSERNVNDHARDAAEVGARGVCVTTWECGLMGAYDTLFPALRACGRILSEGPRDGAFLEAYGEEGADYREWAELLGCRLQECGGIFAHGTRRSSLKCRLLLLRNPFLAWFFHADELCGEAGTKALDVLEKAANVAPNEASRNVALFGIAAVEFVRFAESAAQSYAKGDANFAVSRLAMARQVFDDLGQIARETHERIGGSLADIERCRLSREHVDRVIRRIRQYGSGQLGYVPAFEVITHPEFVPHDQACWWRVNQWAEL